MDRFNDIATVAIGTRALPRYFACSAKSSYPLDWILTLFSSLRCPRTHDLGASTGLTTSCSFPCPLWFTGLVIWFVATFPPLTGLINMPGAAQRAWRKSPLTSTPSPLTISLPSYMWVVHPSPSLNATFVCPITTIVSSTPTLH